MKISYRIWLLKIQIMLMRWKTQTRNASHHPPFKQFQTAMEFIENIHLEGLVSPQILISHFQMYLILLTLRSIHQLSLFQLLYHLRENSTMSLKIVLPIGLLRSRTLQHIAS
jgi:hypothetical protein